MNYTQSDVILAFLKRYFPNEASIVEPYIEPLLQAWREGHTYITLEPKAVEKIQQASNLVSCTIGDTSLKPFVLLDQRLFLAKVAYQEQRLAHQLFNLIAPPKITADMNHIQQAFDVLFGADLATAQVASIALLSRLVIITGGPGTGKTTLAGKILALLCQSLQKPHLKIALCSPTGKAATHLQASLHKAVQSIPDDMLKQHLSTLKGTTIHRLLDIRPPDGLPRFNQDNPVNFDVVLVDEASMIDLQLMSFLVEALPSHACLILLGDADQLPSVAVGAVLSSLVQETCVSFEQKQLLNQWLPENNIPYLEEDKIAGLSSCCVQLKQSHRFGQDSGIGQLAQAVLNNQECEAIFSNYSDVELKPIPNTKNSIFNQYYKLQQAYWQAVKDRDISKVFKHFYDSIVLCALRSDVEWFNQNYHQFLKDKHHTQDLAGLPIIILENDTRTGLYNGDIGIILPEDGTGKLKAYFATLATQTSEATEQYRSFSPSALPAYEDAFALTVHKSQGSEYQKVWFYTSEIDGTNQPLFNRKMLYTAITRARTYFLFMGDKAIFTNIVKKEYKRNSHLAHFLALKSSESRI